METVGSKLPGIGLPPEEQAAALNKMFHEIDPNHPPFVAEASTGGKYADLVANLNNGYPTIVSVSWGAGPLGVPTNSGVGHALLVVGQDTSNGDFLFLDPNGGRLITSSDFRTMYPVDFFQAWQGQPNWFIPAGGMVTIKPGP
jgi:hypothetical protein